MKLIVCSVPDTIPDEQQLVQELLQCGLETFHLRKPMFSIAEMRNWLQDLPESEHYKIVLHSHGVLADEFKLKGIHIGAGVWQTLSLAEQEAWPAYARRKGITISSSVHDQKEINRLPSGLNYVWLSPVFESISKAAYRSTHRASQFDAWVKELKEQKHTAVYALGGVASEHIEELTRRGFDGIVVLGSVWENIQGLQDKERIKQRIKQLVASCKTDTTS